MTCFWDSVIAGLTQAVPMFSFPTPRALVARLKDLNTLPVDVTIDGVGLDDMEQRENVEAITCLDPESLSEGYLCSTADPVLVLVCQVFRINVTHDLAGCTTAYWHPAATRVIHLRSSRSHCVLSSVGGVEAR